MNEINLWLGYGLLSIGFLSLLFYLAVLASITEPKKRYDYILAYEISCAWGVSLLCISGCVFLGNIQQPQEELTLIIVRLILSLALAFMVGFSVRATLRIYYPSVLENRLKKLRFKNRISPAGNSMVMLNEHEEDVYLDQEMQDGEKLRSVSYDVWKDEKTGFVKIEKYVGSFHSDLCPRCNYQTLNIVTEKLVKASSSTSNDLLKSYKCSFCGFKEDKIILLKSRGTSTVFSN